MLRKKGGGKTAARAARKSAARSAVRPSVQSGPARRSARKIAVRAGAVGSKAAGKRVSADQAAAKGGGAEAKPPAPAPDKAGAKSPSQAPPEAQSGVSGRPASPEALKSAEPDDATAASAGTAPAGRRRAQRAAPAAPAVPLPPADAMNAEQIAAVLEQIAALLEITGENPFKVRAYENAARLIPGLGDELQALVETGDLQEVRGIGSGIAEKVGTLARTGKLDYYEELKSKVPPGLLDMLRIPGLGPKKVKLLFDQLEITGIDALEAACREGRLLELRGFGAKSQENILRGIAFVRRASARFLWSVADPHAREVLEALVGHPAVLQAAIAGSLRRRKETVHDVDLLVATRDPEAVSQHFAAGPWVDRVIGSGPTKTSILHPSGLQMDLRVVSAAQFPYALHHFTGSKAHNVAMRGRAQRAGVKMNEYGLFRGEELIPCTSEAEIFAALGLEFIPPELREDEGEIEAAASGALPARLLESGDLRGAFHVHTQYSDGRDSLLDMVEAASARGWQYVGISDHSQSSRARGMSAGRVLEQLAELDRLAGRRLGIRVFRGIEAEVGLDGELDTDADLLRRFDFVIAAVHEGLDLDRETQTRRLLRVLANPFTTILAHPTSRRLFERGGIDVDLAAVFDAAAKRGVAIEINAQPQRMDPDGSLIRQARERGAAFCVDPDAHDVAALANVDLGVGLARRGWLGPGNVLNTWDAERMADHLQRRHAGAEAATS